jgi:hypothetical protein
VLRYIVEQAATQLDLKAVRADQIAAPGQINLQVIDHLLNAKVAVADLTGLNPNVFYEIGVRHAVRLPLVMIAEKDTPLPFDIANMRIIFYSYNDWSSGDKCREDIVAQLRQTLDKGVVDSPVATSVNLTSLSRGDATEQGVAEMVQTVEGVARIQREILTSVDRLTFELAEDRPRISNMTIRDLQRSYREVSEIAEVVQDAHLTEAVKELGRPVRHLLQIIMGRARASDVLNAENVTRHLRHSGPSIAQAQADLSAEARVSGTLKPDVHLSKVDLPKERF